MDATDKPIPRHNVSRQGGEAFSVWSAQTDADRQAICRGSFWREVAPLLRMRDEIRVTHDAMLYDATLTVIYSDGQRSVRVALKSWTDLPSTGEAAA